MDIRYILTNTQIFPRENFRIFKNCVNIYGVVYISHYTYTHKLCYSIQFLYSFRLFTAANVLDEDTDMFFFRFISITAWIVENSVYHENRYNFKVLQIDHFLSAFIPTPLHSRFDSTFPTHIAGIVLLVKKGQYSNEQFSPFEFILLQCCLKFALVLVRGADEGISFGGASGAFDNKGRQNRKVGCL